MGEKHSARVLHGRLRGGLTVVEARHLGRDPDRLFDGNRSDVANLETRRCRGRDRAARCLGAGLGQECCDEAVVRDPGRPLLALGEGVLGLDSPAVGEMPVETEPSLEPDGAAPAERVVVGAGQPLRRLGLAVRAVLERFLGPEEPVLDPAPGVRTRQRVEEKPDEQRGGDEARVPRRV